MRPQFPAPLCRAVLLLGLVLFNGPGRLGAQQTSAKRQGKSDEANTAVRKELAAKLYAAWQVSWKLERDLAAARNTVTRKEAALELTSKNAASAERAASQMPEDKQLQKNAATAADAAAKTRVELESARNKLHEARTAIAAARDNAATLETELVGGLKGIASQDWDYEKARHLLFRAGFGGSPREIQELVEMGLHQAVEHLVEYHQQPPANLEIDIRPQGSAAAYERLLDSEARRVLQQRQRQSFRNQVAVMRQWWLQRMVVSPRPLEEKLTLFWHDHFAVNYRDFNDPYLVYSQNQLFRRYADQFNALLHGIVQDPAMIRYLDNHTNRKGNGNENLGRELQELFSIGEENSANHRPNGYSENDVREASRALTGYTFDQATGQFRFLGTRHDETSKSVLGRNGNWSGDEIIDIILQHPATAEYVTKKLFEYFVHRNPRPETIQRLAQVLRANNYELRPMLKNLFLSEEFYSSEARGGHIKSPAELLVGTIRVLEIRTTDYARLDNACQTAGQALFEPPNVAGWEEGQAWITSKQLLDRYNFASDLVDRQDVDLLNILGDGRTFRSAADLVDHLVARCLVTDVGPEKRQAMIAFLGDLPPSAEWESRKDEIATKLRALVVMLLSTPEYQVS